MSNSKNLTNTYFTQLNLGLFVTFFILPLLFAVERCSGQCVMALDKTDEFTGERTVIANPLKLLSLTKVMMSRIINKSDASNFIMITVTDLGCLSRGNSVMYLKFDDGTVKTYIHKGKTSCGSVEIFLADVSDDMATLKSKPVTKIRVAGTERSVDMDIKQPDYFIKATMCIDQHL